MPERRRAKLWVAGILGFAAVIAAAITGSSADRTGRGQSPAARCHRRTASPLG